MIMRSHYPITTHRFALPAMHSMPGRQRRDSLLVLQEEIQFPAHRGLAGTRRLKIVHIEQAAGLPDAMIPNSTYENDSHNFLHFSNLKCLSNKTFPVMTQSETL
jgi:hypothetical protein